MRHAVYDLFAREYDGRTSGETRRRKDLCMVCSRDLSGSMSVWLAAFVVGTAAVGCRTAPSGLGASQAGGRVVQGNAVFTVSESKRLIAKAVAKMPVVQNALQHGMVIVCKGTTNTYVAEELLGRKIPHGAYVLGRVAPQKGARQMPNTDPIPEVVLVKGQHRPDLTLDAALQQLAPGDVVIKGGNALDYANKTVGVWNGNATGGTTGKILPRIAACKAHLVVPIGLEKLVAGRVVDIAGKIDEPADNLSGIPRMRILPGQAVTEIEALKILANVDAFQASAGGIGGAEGAVWLLWRGKREDVEKARAIAASIQGEAPFIP
jgi:hypothetical protein